MNYKNVMTREQELILKLLREALLAGTGSRFSGISEDTWHTVIGIADEHAVLPMLYDVLEPHFGRMRAQDRGRVQERTLVCVRQYYFLSYLTANVLHALWEENIPAVVFKGVSAASFYPHPAYRKSGDIDLFLPDRTTLKRAEDVVRRFGFHRLSQQTTVYHVEFWRESGPELELHTFLTEPFESERTNREIEQVIRSGSLGMQEFESEGGRFQTFADAGIAFSLLVHMLHHYMRSGFGLKFLADWVVFWNAHPGEDDPAKNAYRKMVLFCGIDGFSDVVTGVCRRYLGLDSPGLCSSSDDGLCREFIEDVFQSGEFGGEDSSRMVALQGDSPVSYLREFHHRTRLNFPNASRFPILYPALWAVALVRFLKNNRTIRHTGLTSVMREAGRRGEISKKMHLFDRKCH